MSGARQRFWWDQENRSPRMCPYCPDCEFYLLRPCFAGTTWRCERRPSLYRSGCFARTLSLLTARSTSTLQFSFCFKNLRWSWKGVLFWQHWGYRGASTGSAGQPRRDGLPGSVPEVTYFQSVGGQLNLLSFYLFLKLVRIFSNHISYHLPGKTEIIFTLTLVTTVRTVYSASHATLAGVLQLQRNYSLTEKVFSSYRESILRLHRKYSPAWHERFTSMLVERHGHDSSRTTHVKTCWLWLDCI